MSEQTDERGTPIEEAIQYKDIDLVVTGTWIPASPATREEPADGGYLDDNRISVDGGPDITAVIAPDDEIEIMTLVEQRLRARGMR
ncbi:MAG: hypothetical protein ACOC2N_05975 [Spirochaetota bacterium]